MFRRRTLLHEIFLNKIKIFFANFNFGIIKRINKFCHENFYIFPTMLRYSIFILIFFDYLQSLLLKFAEFRFINVPDGVQCSFNFARISIRIFSFFFLKFCIISFSFLFFLNFFITLHFLFFH
jgi:hypothetical protein